MMLPLKAFDALIGVDGCGPLMQGTHRCRNAFNDVQLYHIVEPSHEWVSVGAWDCGTSFQAGSCSRLSLQHWLPCKARGMPDVHLRHVCQCEFGVVLSNTLLHQCNLQAGGHSGDEEQARTRSEHEAMKTTCCRRCVPWEASVSLWRKFCYRCSL